MSTVSAEEYENMIREECPFCKIVDGRIPTKKVYEDSTVLAFLDINPASFGHTLVITKKHYANLSQVSDADVSHLFKVVKKITGILSEFTQKLSGDKLTGVNVMQNNGAPAGQQVPHVHVHIIPRVEKDGVIQPWEPKKFDEKQVDSIQSAILTAMKGMTVSPEKTHHLEHIQVKHEEKTEKKEHPKTKSIKRIPRSP